MFKWRRPVKRVLVAAQAGRFPHPVNVLFQMFPVYSHVKDLFAERALPGTAQLKQAAIDSWMTNNFFDWKRVIRAVSDEQWERLWLECAYGSVDAHELQSTLQRERRRWLRRTAVEEVRKEFPCIEQLRWTHRQHQAWVSGAVVLPDTTVQQRQELRDVFGSRWTLCGPADTEPVELCDLVEEDDNVAQNWFQEEDAIRRQVEPTMSDHVFDFVDSPGLVSARCCIQ